jgi:hypothetical protein
MASEQQSASQQALPGGEYRAPRWFVPIAVLATLATAGVGVGFVIRNPDLPSQSRWAILGLACVIAVLLSVYWLGQVKRARWDGTGVEFTWWWGSSHFYPWDELASVKVDRAPWWSRSYDRTSVITADGDEIEVEPSGRNYEAFMAAVKAHLEERKRLEGG